MSGETCRRAPRDAPDRWTCRGFNDNAFMPDIASVLKAEIGRLARKEVKLQTEATQRASAQHRGEIASLKRRVQELERLVERLAKQAAKASTAPPVEADRSAHRFSAKGLASQRRRLGLSAEDFARLIGASALSIYKWESGRAKPRARFMPAIAAVRSMGKKEAARRLAAA